MVTIKRLHQNNFGLLRLIFATAVIFSHSFPLAQGWKNDEPLLLLTGTITFGGVAVDGFFLLSGYLIIKSAMRSDGAWSFLKKRIARIYPGFIVASLVSLLVGFLVGGRINGLGDAARSIIGILTLSQPVLAGAFDGLAYRALNGSLWTISYEFFCYLVALALCLTKLANHRAVVLTGALGLLIFSGLCTEVDALHKLHNGTRLLGIFLTGSSFHLFREQIRYNTKLAVAALICGSVLILSQWTMPLAMAVCGGYLLFWVGFMPMGSRLSAIGQTNDISYGTYLYAWPIQNLLLWTGIAHAPLTVFAIAVPIAYLAGFLSWKLVEAPVMGLGSVRPSRPLPR